PRHHGVGAGVGGNLVPARHILFQPSWVRAGEPRPQAPSRRRDLSDKLVTRNGLTPGARPGFASAFLLIVSSFPAGEEAGDGRGHRVVAGDDVAAGMFEDQGVR